MTFPQRDSLFARHDMSEETQKVSEDARSTLWALAVRFTEATPGTPEQTIAVRRLQEALMACNLALAIHGVNEE